MTTIAFNASRRPLRHQCADPSCAVVDENKLFQCTECEIVRYCCKEHQDSHRAQHQSLCDEVKQRRAKLVDTADWDEDDRFYWTDCDYVLSREALLDTIVPAPTLDSAHVAIDYMFDLELLVPTGADYEHFYCRLPALLLRTGQDEACYKFIDDRNNKNLFPTPEPDPTVDPVHLLPKFRPHWASIRPDHVITILLLDLKILVDIRNLKVARKVLLSTPIPPELFEPIELAVLSSPLSQPLVKASLKEMILTEATLLRHIHVLADYRVDFISVLLGDKPAWGWPEYGEGLDTRDLTEAWLETEGVMEVLCAARRLARQETAWAGLVEDFMRHREELYKSRPHSFDTPTQTPEEVFDEIGIHRI